MADEPNNNQNNNNESQNKQFSLNTLVVSVLAVAAISIGGTYAVMSNQESDETADDTTSTETTSQVVEDDTSSFPVFDEAYEILTNGSIYDTEDEILIEGAINGMADAVDDPYTDYLDETEVTSLNDQVEGSFEGIGAEVMKQGEYVRIVSPIPGSPAEEAGLLPNDLISAVDGESVADLSIDEAVNLIRGEEGTDVTLTITRGDLQVDVTITRGTIPVETVYAEVDESDPSIGHITISNFAADTSVDLIEAIENLASQGVENYIFDLRGNPGGLLTSGLETTNIFMEDGELIISIEDALGNAEEYVAGEQFGLYKFSGNAVALVNGGSASAAEIMASGMQSAGIPLIGESTFGKGTVQSVIPLETGGQLKYTSARWLTGSGEWINETGITPDVEVSLPDYANLFYINSENVYQSGQTSDEVANINSILIALGYDAEETNEYTEQTTAAVQQFQAEHNLEEDGIVTGETAVALIETLQNLIANNDTQYDAAVDYFQGELDVNPEETSESTEETTSQE